MAKEYCSVWTEHVVFTPPVSVGTGHFQLLATVSNAAVHMGVPGPAGVRLPARLDTEQLLLL